MSASPLLQPQQPPSVGRRAGSQEPARARPTLRVHAHSACRLVHIQHALTGPALAIHPRFDGHEWRAAVRAWAALTSAADDLKRPNGALDIAMAGLLRDIALDRWRALGHAGWRRLLAWTAALNDDPKRADAATILLAWVAWCLGWHGCVRDAHDHTTHASSEHDAMMPSNDALEMPDSASEQLELAARCAALDAGWWSAWRALDVLRGWANGASPTRFALCGRALDVLDAVDVAFSKHGIADGPLAVLDTLRDIQRALIRHDPSSPARMDLARVYAARVLNTPVASHDPNLIQRAYKELTELSRYTSSSDPDPLALSIRLLEAWLRLGDPQAEAALSGLLMILPSRRMDMLTLRAVRLCLYAHTPSRENPNRNLDLATSILQNFLERACIAPAHPSKTLLAEANALHGLILLARAEAGEKTALDMAQSTLHMADRLLMLAPDDDDDDEPQRERWRRDVRLGCARCTALEASLGWDLTQETIQHALTLARDVGASAHRASDTDLKLQAHWVESRLTAISKAISAPQRLQDALTLIDRAVDDLDLLYGATPRMGLHTAGRPMRDVFKDHRSRMMYAKAHS